MRDSEGDKDSPMCAIAMRISKLLLRPTESFFRFYHLRGCMLGRLKLLQPVLC